MSTTTYDNVPSERSDSGYNTPGKNKKDKSILKEPKLNSELIKVAAQHTNQKKIEQKVNSNNSILVAVSSAWNVAKT